MSNIKGAKCSLGTEEVKQVESFTYLGVVFGKRASWSAMEKKLAERAVGKTAKVMTLRRMYDVDVSRLVGRPVGVRCQSLGLQGAGITGEGQKKAGALTYVGPGIH